MIYFMPKPEDEPIYLLNRERTSLLELKRGFITSQFSIDASRVEVRDIGELVSITASKLFRTARDVGRALWAKVANEYRARKQDGVNVAIEIEVGNAPGIAYTHVQYAHLKFLDGYKPDEMKEVPETFMR